MIDKPVILLALEEDRLYPGIKDELAAAADGREALISVDENEIEPFLERIEIGFADVPFALVPRMKNLKWLQLWSAGADALQRFPALKELPFALTTASGIHGQQIAEHVFAMILSVNRLLPQAIEAQKQRRWLREPDAAFPVLAGKSLLIAGYGTIGEFVGKIAADFNMKVTGLRRRPWKSGGADGGVLVEDASRLRAFLPEADYVLNLLPATGDTRGCFGAAEFALMKSGAVYLNMGRGATTDEAALAEALRQGRPGMAMLDVFETEPLPPSSPLWNLNNVLITSHNAGRRRDYTRLAMALALDNLKRYLQGKPLRNLVDKQAGY